MQRSPDQERFVLHPGERLDDLQRDGAKLIQNPELFCFGMDAVLLTAFAEGNLKPESRVLDLCSGNGVISILMNARYHDRVDREPMTDGKPVPEKPVPGTYAGDGESVPGTYAGDGEGVPGTGIDPARQPYPDFTGLEINSICVDMAKRSTSGNGESDHVHFLQGNLKKIRDLVPAAGFDLVTVNPPYMIGGHGLTGANEALTIARHEVACTIDDVCAAAEYAAKPQGRVCMVHRPFRLADIFRSMNRHHLEPKRMRMVQPMADKEPNMVLIEAVRGGRPRLAVERPLVIYERQGVYTEEVRKLYG